MGLNILKSLVSLPMNTHTNIINYETPMYPLREDSINIILVIGESMRYDNYVEQKLKKQNHFYKKIYAGATNTDVSLPLLLNAKNNPLKLNKENQTNLFKLAKKSNFTTAFISMQSENSLRYIKPYLQLKHIDNYKSFEKNEAKPKFDFFLLKELEKFDFSKKRFIVLQQIGQHSPYHYFEGKKLDDNSKNYKKSVDYSFRFYHQLHNYLNQLKKPFILIYTSDHGEFSGENGRYGHNNFDPIIYEVPMFITSNSTLPINYKQINSHYDLSQFLTYLLGYKKELKFEDAKTVINGTMISREDGFIIIN
jgi:glucan phosphoethanolaminetransferase (alkaline phosphatase superfamily)